MLSIKLLAAPRNRGAEEAETQVEESKCVIVCVSYSCSKGNIDRAKSALAEADKINVYIQQQQQQQQQVYFSHFA